MLDEKTSAPPPNHQKTGQIGKVRELFPEVKGWQDETISEYLPLLREAYEHITGKCAGYELYPIGSNIPRLHTYKHPTETPGEFAEKECPASRQKVCRALTRELPKRFLSLRLEELDAKGKVAEFVENFQELKAQGRGLLIAGPVGTGKSQLVVSLLVELVNRYLVRVKFLTFSELLELFKQSINDESKAVEANSLFREDVIAIDDIGTGRVSDFDMDKVNAFIDRIYREMTPCLIVSTNLNKKDLAAHIGERVISRLTEMCEPIVLTGKDRRVRKEG